MTDKQDGGPAFPNIVPEDPSLPITPNNTVPIGMTLRDYFAAKFATVIFESMEKFAAHGNWTLWATNENEEKSALIQAIELSAAAAYIFADAMLKERAK